MKTTIDIADGLLSEARERARHERTTLRALVEEGLRKALDERSRAAQRPLKPVTGRLQPLPGVDPDDWDAVFDSIYAQDELNLR